MGNIIRTFESFSQAPLEDPSRIAELRKRNYPLRGSGQPTWEPLYDFLEGMFGDGYKKAADAFMFMGSTSILGTEYFSYKNGLNRKSVLLDASGVPFHVSYESVWVRNEESVSGVSIILNPVGVREMSNEEAFNKLYDGYELYTAKGVMDKDNPYFTSYTAWTKHRDKYISDNGMKGVSVTKPSDFDPKSL
jgi:hypothetical protein